MSKSNQSIKKNTIANFIGFGYTSAIGIVIYPLYLKYLGGEAYGLVGFFTLMQSWLYILDMGLSPTLSRQVSYARGKAGGFNKLIKLLRSLEIIFMIIAVLVVVMVLSSNDFIANKWINAEELDGGVIAYCLMLMGMIVALRFLSSLYKSGIYGMEDHVWLNSANIVLISLKFIGALMLMHFISRDIEVFFEYQLVIGIIELLVLGSRFYSIMPVAPLLCGIRYYHASVMAVAPFALSIAYSTGVWIVLTQTDKLILSTLLPLEEFGYFSIIALFSAGVSMLTAPLTQALLPRMTKLHSEGKSEQLIEYYRKATQLSVVISFTAAVVIAAFPDALLYMMTGDVRLAEWGSGILPYFALGSGFLALSSFQYHLQNAYGDLKLHVRGSTLSIILQTPVIIVATVNFGAIGAGISWFVIRLAWFIVWSALVHNRLIPGFHKQWIAKDILPILFSACLGGLVLDQFILQDMSDGRLSVFLQLAISSVIVFFIAAMMSSFLLGYIRTAVMKVARRG